MNCEIIKDLIPLYIDGCCSEESEEIRIKRQKLVTAVILLSQGIPFIHAGQEFLRTKKGEHNSYILPDSINKLDWTLMEKNIDVINYIKDVISIRKEFKCFKLESSEEILNNTDVSFTNNGLCVYKLKTVEKGLKELIVIINPNNNVELYSLNEDYKVILTENGKVLEPYNVCNLIINPCSLVILVK
jgi:pullulanase